MLLGLLGLGRVFGLGLGFIREGVWDVFGGTTQIRVYPVVFSIFVLSFPI